MSKLLEKLGFTPDWKAVKFKARGFNGVETNEVHFGDYGECVAEYVYEDKDALLIASAPEVLEALIGEWQFIESYLAANASINDRYWYNEFLTRQNTITLTVEKALGMTWDEIVPSSISNKEYNKEKEFEELWKEYPRKTNKFGGKSNYLKLRKDGFTHDQLLSSVSKYAIQVLKDKTEAKFIMHCKTFFGRDRQFEDYIGKTPEEVSTGRHETGFTLKTCVVDDCKHTWIGGGNYCPVCGTDI